MLLRMADLMQVNICNASKSAGASYEHKKGTEFRIADARTYVAISGTIDLDLLLLDISYFNEMFKKIDDDMETSMDKYGKIKYFGLQGY